MFIAEHGAFDRGDKAPDTPRKQRLINDGQSQNEQDVRALAQRVIARHKTTRNDCALSIRDVAVWLEEKERKGLLPSPATLRDWLIGEGLFPIKGSNVDGRLTVDGSKTYICTAIDHREGDFTADNLKESRLTPLKIRTLMSEDDGVVQEEPM